jgi:periplasmic protein CpxP/Spy
MRLAILVSFAAALGAVPALAAAPAPPPGAGWHRPDPAQFAAHRAEMEAKRSADIALLLGLRPDQKPALDSFLAAAMPHGPHHDQGPDRGPGHGPDGAPPPQDEGTVAALDHMSQHIDARDAEAKQRIAATKRFYTSLTADQQQRFDAMMHLMHGMGGHRGMGGHGDGQGEGRPPMPPMH